MKKLLIFALFIISYSSTSAQTDCEDISAVLNDFIEGTVYNYPDRINSAFYPDTKMFLHVDADTVFTVQSEEYASWYGRKKPGTKNSREGKIIAIEVVLDVAYAKIQVEFPKTKRRYYDLLLLKKVAGEWKITSKCTSAEPLEEKP